MKLTSTAAIALAVLGISLFPAVPVFAVPTLQLDIVGGTYDEETETIVGPSGEEITLVALLTPRPSDDLAEMLGDTYFVSAALLPAVEESGDLGSFTFQTGGGEAQTVDATGDMAFGVPPGEPLQAFDAKDLSKHGVFETYFSEFSFMFDPTQEAATYDSQDTPGGDLDLTGTGSFFQTFTVSTSLLASGFDLHFDLYRTEMVGDIELLSLSETGEDLLDLFDRDRFAPFSHDAGTHRDGMPEPMTLLLLGAGLTGIAVMRRRQKQSR